MHSITSDHLVVLQAEGVELTDSDIAALRATCSEAMDVIRALLPDLTPTLNITVYPGASCDGLLDPDVPIGARALNADWIRLVIDPAAHGGFAATVRNHLLGALAHESHHCARMRAFPALAAGPVPIADAVVFEGLATAFERDVSGSVPAWGDYADVPVQTWADEVLAVDGAYAYGAWFFAHPDGRRWIGYRAGAYLADCATQFAGTNAGELVTTPTAQVLEYAMHSRG